MGLIENGSWAPTAGRTMACMLAGMKQIETLELLVTIRSSMNTTDVPLLEELADNLLATE
ncbi:MAG: hypothetical protein LUC45_00900 [Paraprevotella sp.]|nr:hypothetical protein [Paraprevotella sp.]